MAIHDDDVKRVRDETDITTIISQYVALKKVGRSWVGLCPFHTEKTPSFSVNAEEGFYYCFGCQESGDVINFARDMEQLDFVGAVEWLAEKANITLRYTNEGDGQKRKQRNELIELVDQAATFYHERLLNSPDAGKARAYLRQRGYDRATVEQFRIGYSPDSWDALVKHLRAPAQKLVAAGLAFENSQNRPTDFFRGRLMFPIHDANGAAVAFGGRMLPEGHPPKYKNSAKNRIYDKSRVLYALNWAKKSVVDAGRIIVCEGYTDVIGCHRAGATQAVATCGTALTDEHVKLMTRFAPRIILAFDADGAGKAAADRFYDWERTHDIEVFVADLPDGVDPGELAESDPERLRAALDGARPFLEYRIRRVLDAAELDRPEGRARAAETAAAVIAEHPNELVRDQYLVDVAGKCRVDVAQMRRLVANPPRPAPVPEQTQRRPDQRSPEHASPDHDPFDPAFQDGYDSYDTGHELQDGPAPRWDRSERPIPLVEVNALRAFMHEGETVGPLMLPTMFTHEVSIAAYVNLSSPGWADRIDDLEHDTAQLLRRLSVEEVDGDPVEYVSRALDAVLVRWRTDMLHEAAGDLERLRQWGPLDQWLALRQEEMHLEESRPAAVQAVVDWLRAQTAHVDEVGEPGDQGQPTCRTIDLTADEISMEQHSSIAMPIGDIVEQAIEGDD
jgi:DNA primase